MQIHTDESRSATPKYLPILLDKHFPVNDPYLNRPHAPNPEPGQTPHYHDTFELGLCQEGSGLFIVGHQTLSFAAGDLSVMLPGVPHIARSNRQDISRWHFIDIDLQLLFDGDQPDNIKPINPDQASLLARFRGPDGFSGLISRSRQSASLAFLVPQLIRELENRDAYALRAIRATVALILVELARQADREQLTLPAGKPNQQAVTDIMPAILHISRHYDQELPIPELAALCRLSVSAFRRRFRLVFSQSPTDYLYQVRIRVARTLLRQDRYPITEIAGMVGYPTISSFNRHFRKYAGQSPTAWLRANR